MACGRMRVALLMLGLLVVSLAPPLVAAECSMSNTIVGEGGTNQVWVSQWSCAGGPDARSTTLAVKTFSPFSPTSQTTLLTVTAYSRVDDGAFQTWTRHDTLSADAAGTHSVVDMTTWKSTDTVVRCRATVTVVGTTATRDAPLPACVPIDGLLL